MKVLKAITAAAIFTASFSAIAAPVTLSDITSNASHTETDSGDQVFRLTDTSVGQNDATAFLLLELAGNANINSFGILGAGNVQLEVFSGSQSPTTSATLEWDVNSNLVTNLATGNSAIIDDQLFGFYLEGVDGTIFSITALNGGLDLMQSFDVGSSGHSDLFGSDIILAFEDTLSGDLDFNDFVVGISDIEGLQGITNFEEVSPVPAPTPLALMGLGLIGLGLMKKKATKVS